MASSSCRSSTPGPSANPPGRPTHWRHPKGIVNYQPERASPLQLLVAAAGPHGQAVDVYCRVADDDSQGPVTRPRPDQRHKHTCRMASKQWTLLM